MGLATIYVSELEVQLRPKKMEQINQLRMHNKALTDEMEQLKKTLLRNKALHDEAKLHRDNKIKDLELQLSEKKATEAEALCKVNQMEKDLLRQKESREQQQVCLAQVTDNNNTLKEALIMTQTKLENQQQQWEEERSRLTQSLNQIQLRLEEEEKARQTRLDDMMDRIGKLEEEISNITKPKRPSLRKRFLRLFK